MPLPCATLRLDRPVDAADVVGTRLPYRGPMHDDASAARSSTAVLGVVPPEILLVPITVRERVVGVLFGEHRMRHTFDDQLALAGARRRRWRSSASSRREARLASEDFSYWRVRRSAASLSAAHSDGNAPASSKSECGGSASNWLSTTATRFAGDGDRPSSETSPTYWLGSIVSR